MTQNTREKIIQTAARLISQTENANVTLSQIGQELGMTHAAIYKHFNNKQALWEAVTTVWFRQTIIESLNPISASTQSAQLHNWLWALVNAKKKAYLKQPKMFALNTQYIDNNPIALHHVLVSAYQQINQIMDYQDPNYQQAETLLSAFAVFMLPNFKDTWTQPDYQARFEKLWNLVKAGI